MGNFVGLAPKRRKVELSLRDLSDKNRKFERLSKELDQISCQKNEQIQVKDWKKNLFHMLKMLSMNIMTTLMNYAIDYDCYFHQRVLVTPTMIKRSILSWRNCVNVKLSNDEYINMNKIQL